MPNDGCMNNTIIDPIDTDRVYVLNFNGKKGGVVRSIDGGETWKQVLEFDTKLTFASAIVFNPANSKYMYACWEKGLFFPMMEETIG